MSDDKFTLVDAVNIILSNQGMKRLIFTNLTFKFKQGIKLENILDLSGYEFVSDEYVLDETTRRKLEEVLVDYIKGEPDFTGSHIEGSEKAHFKKLYDESLRDVEGGGTRSEYRLNLVAITESLSKFFKFHFDPRVYGNERFMEAIKEIKDSEQKKFWEKVFKDGTPVKKEVDDNILGYFDATLPDDFYENNKEKINGILAACALTSHEEGKPSAPSEEALPELVPMPNLYEYNRSKFLPKVVDWWNKQTLLAAVRNTAKKHEEGKANLVDLIKKEYGANPAIKGLLNVLSFGYNLPKGRKVKWNDLLKANYDEERLLCYGQMIRQSARKHPAWYAALIGGAVGVSFADVPPAIGAGIAIGIPIGALLLLLGMETCGPVRKVAKPCPKPEYTEQGCIDNCSPYFPEAAAGPAPVCTPEVEIRYRDREKIIYQYKTIRVNVPTKGVSGNRYDDGSKVPGGVSENGRRYDK